jgi:RNA polymerase sigma-70 factor (ECF subfamily)
MTAQQQEAIFRGWLDAHIGLMLKVVRGCAAAPPDQDDLFQEVLLQLWSSIPAFRGEAKATTWIYRVAWNTALAWRRGERRRREGHETFIKLSPPSQVQPSHLDSQPQQEIVERLYAASLNPKPPLTTGAASRGHVTDQGPLNHPSANLH